MNIILDSIVSVVFSKDIRDYLISNLGLTKTKANVLALIIQQLADIIAAGVPLLILIYVDDKYTTGIVNFVCVMFAMMFTNYTNKIMNESSSAKLHRRIDELTKELESKLNDKASRDEVNAGLERKASREEVKEVKAGLERKASRDEVKEVKEVLEHKAFRKEVDELKIIIDEHKASRDEVNAGLERKASRKEVNELKIMFEERTQVVYDSFKQDSLIYNQLESPIDDVIEKTKAMEEARALNLAKKH